MNLNGRSAAFILIATLFVLLSDDSRGQDEERYRIQYRRTPKGDRFSVATSEQEKDEVTRTLRSRRRQLAKWPSTEFELFRKPEVQKALDLSPQQAPKIRELISEIEDREQQYSKEYLAGNASREDLLVFLAEREAAIRAVLSSSQEVKLKRILATVLLHKRGPTALLEYEQFQELDLTEGQREKLAEYSKKYEEEALQLLQEIFWRHTIEALELSLEDDQKVSIRRLLEPELLEELFKGGELDD